MFEYILGPSVPLKSRLLEFCDPAVKSCQVPQNIQSHCLFENESAYIKFM